MKGRSRRRHLLGALAIVGVGVGVLAAPPMESTDATWTDAEHARSSALTARVLTAPPVANFTVTTCSSPWIGTNPALTVRWQMPADAPAGAALRWQGPGQVSSVTPTALGNGQFEITFTRNQLGWDWATPANITITGRTAIGAWTSGSARTIQVIRSGITGNPQCPIS